MYHGDVSFPHLTPRTVTKARPQPQGITSQQVKLLALTSALTLAKGKIIIYTRIPNIPIISIPVPTTARKRLLDSLRDSYNKWQADLSPS